MVLHGCILVCCAEVGGVTCGLIQRDWLQALFAEDTENKLSIQISKRKLILQAVGDDPPSQMAQLLALEYLVGVTDPDRRNQVICCFFTDGLYS